MQAKDIETHLAELGKELHEMGLQLPIRILLVGGAFMLTQIKNRQATNDIDVLLKDIEDSTASPLYQTFKSATRYIARKNKMPNSWLNDVIGDFLRDLGSVPEGRLWRRYDKLEVYLPPDEYIFALKLLAGRQKDRDDILALSKKLKMQTREQAQKVIDRYIPDKQLQQMNNVEKTLTKFFK
jgi:Nucleotidyltransferase of unknown function (DUF6036)